MCGRISLRTRSRSAKFDSARAILKVVATSPGRC